MHLQLSSIVVLSATVLALTSASVYRSCTQNGLFAFTFDNGPGAGTRSLLNILADKKAHATFHVDVGHLTDPNVQSSIQSIVAGGHLVGLSINPSVNLFQMTDNQVGATIIRQANALSKFTGYTIQFIRLPYNGYDDRILRVIKELGMTTTVHSVETFDYTGDSSKVYSSVELALSLADPASSSQISLQHDNNQQSVAITPKLIDLVTSSGYTIVTLDQCLGMADFKKNTTPLKGGNFSGSGSSSGSGSGASGSPANTGGNADAGSSGKGGSADGSQLGSETSGAATSYSGISAAIMAAIIAVVVQL